MTPFAYLPTFVPSSSARDSARWPERRRPSSGKYTVSVPSTKDTLSTIPSRCRGPATRERGRKRKCGCRHRRLPPTTSPRRHPLRSGSPHPGAMCAANHCRVPQSQAWMARWPACSPPLRPSGPSRPPPRSPPQVIPLPLPLPLPPRRRLLLPRDPAWNGRAAAQAQRGGQSQAASGLPGRAPPRCLGTPPIRCVRAADAGPSPPCDGTPHRSQGSARCRGLPQVIAQQPPRCRPEERHGGPVGDHSLSASGATH